MTTIEAQNFIVLSYIKKYAADEKRLGRGRSKEIFFNRSVTYWTCKKLYSEIRSNPSVPAREVIEKFAHLMDEYACKANKGTMFSNAFSTAYDVTNDIWDMLDLYNRTEDRHG